MLNSLTKYTVFPVFVFIITEGQFQSHRELFVVPADCVGGFTEGDCQFFCLFVPLILSGAPGKGTGSPGRPTEQQAGVDESQPHQL